jgi:hypothetical protein
MMRLVTLRAVPIGPRGLRGLRGPRGGHAVPARVRRGNAGRPHTVRTPVAVRASDSEEEEDFDAENLISSLINDNPEPIKRITDAANKVAELQLEQQKLNAELAALEGDVAEQQAAREKKAEQEAAELMADAEVRAAQLLLQAAELDELDVRAAKMRQLDDLNKIESVKAGLISAVGGVLSSLPWLFATSQSSVLNLAADLAVAGATAFLFGVVYRYAVRGDATNSQLKGGVVGAFGLTRGLSLAEGLLRGGWGGEQVGTAAVGLGQSMLLFGFCAAALELGVRMNWVEIQAVDNR